MINIHIPQSEQAKFRAWVRQLSADNKNKCRGLINKHTHSLHRRVVRSLSTAFQYKTVKTKKGYREFTSMGSFGGLKGSARTAFSSDGLGGEVLVGGTKKTGYAPYQEFGTGRFAPLGIMPGYEEYARQFKGRGIRQVNIYPKMFMFPHFERIKKELVKDLNFMGFR